MLDRLERGTTPGRHDDGYRLGLAVEGGGMRGVISCGMLIGLEQLGLRNTFDFVVGTSAGAIGASFFVGRQATNASVIYYTDLISEPFLNKRRLLRLKPAMDIDYLIDEACVQRGLNGLGLAESDLPMYATAAPVDPENADTLFRLDGSSERVRSILKATASLPVLGGGSREIDGAEYVDGGLQEQIPWRSAMTLGATHILALPSQPVLAVDDQQPMSFIEQATVGRLVKAMHGPHIAEVVRTLGPKASHEFAALRSIADGDSCAICHDGSAWDGVIDVVDVPRDAHLPDRLENDRTVLVRAMAAGARHLLEHFDMKGVTVEPRITLDHPGAGVIAPRRGFFRDLLLDEEE